MKTTNFIAIAIAIFMVAIKDTECLSCFCEGAECPYPMGCTAGYTMDICGCCTVCAKDVGQACGGLWGMEGTCGEGMDCIKNPRDMNFFKVGTCRFKETNEVKVISPVEHGNQIP